MNDLPISEVLPALGDALARRPAVVLQAPPGAGKTTLVPLALLDAPWLAGRRILVLEPRRLAARAAAARMSELRGEPIGQTVGYRVRFESRIGPRTRIEVLTEGILTRRLQSDPGLEDAGLVIFDEFHERHLHTDLALALARDSQRLLRPDLKILVMSATLDGQGIARVLEAPLVESAGRAHPVAIHYLPREPEAPLAERVATAVRAALARDEGDVLAFLPGAGEIRRARELLGTTGEADVLPLYGDLSWEDQARALRPGGAHRKVVLATPIAETSLTIEGVRVVVDSGYARVPEFDPRSGLTRLVTARISRASADQRAGRAGRLGPGVCYRLWTESTHRGLAAQPTPEIKSADLASFALELAAWGTDPAALTWLDSPPPAALAQARGLLAMLGAIDEAGAITASGRAMADLPVHPRLAHMLRVAAERGAAYLACDLAALVSERDVYAGTRRTVDLIPRLEALEAARREGHRGARNHGADPGACARAVQAAAQFRHALHAKPDRGPHDAGLLLALAYPDRIGMQRAPGEPRYLLASGRGARLPAYESRLSPPWLVAPVVDAGEAEGVIHLAAAVDLAELRRMRVDSIRVADVVGWDEASESVLARREERLGDLLLASKTTPDTDGEQVRGAMLDGIRRLGIGALPWSGAAREWQARVLSLRAWFPDEGWPDVADAALAARLETWLGPWLDGITRRAHLARLDLTAILNTLLDPAQARRLDEHAPTHVRVPSGSRVRLQYRAGESPVLAVKLQEMFGQTDTPRVAGGRVPVTLHLLSPAQRPIQVTQDLRGFWERTYPEVRKELKGRYPKHPWPDDPLTALPTARPARRRG
ncbi:ATP-dependent helicase [Sulfurifustis variabilis]|uniref:ATP-dependent helicase n=1 Tax=Sulfurifustis variabilis TaxID=1675686 RepID=A0A1B4VDU7_9GAMM|nr:ATP-dependent helicase HrpB [Sulfurifustis variabilis]BAU48697.1 ATP-dependent helicase [Sulfurifustis variabilis]